MELLSNLNLLIELLNVFLIISFILIIFKDEDGIIKYPGNGKSAKLYNELMKRNLKFKHG